MASQSLSSSSRSNSAPTSSRGSPSGQTSSSTSSLNRSGSVDHQSLLTPVVRSKRTPIACTECRRRQVKCTGATPKCERCEKKGVKCEYIPCSQQKATTASPSSSPAQLAPPYNPKSPHQNAQYTPSQWQSSGRSHQMYMTESSMPYQQHPEWQANNSASMLQQSQLYGNANYSQSSYPSSNSSAISAMPRTASSYGHPGIVPSQAYMGVGYTQLIGGQSLQYPYDVAGSEPPHIVASQMTNYPEYYQSPPGDAFDTRATGMVSEHTEKAWADSVGPYSSFQGHYV